MHGLFVAARPLFLGGGLLLFVLGVLTGAGSGDPLRCALGLLVVVLVHILTHYVNDAEDVATDAQSDPTALTGGSRAIQRGLVTPALLLRASAWLAGLVGGVAVVDLLLGDWLAALLHLATLLFGYAYSGRPFQLGRRGCSELDAALVMGVLVPLAGAHARGGINRATWALCAVLFVETIFARLSTAYPDLEADRATGKRTIPALVGARGSVLVFAAVGIAIAVVGLLLAEQLPFPAWQRARALAVAAACFAAVGAIGSSLATRRRLTVPLLGFLAYAVSLATLAATTWRR